MSGHRHKGKRSEWFKCNERPPHLDGQYEWCVDPDWETEMKVIEFDSIGRGFIQRPIYRFCAWFCMMGFWRGLAEKPE